MGNGDIKPKKDQQLATADGQPVGETIHGLKIRRLPPLEDGRGELIELFRQDWDFHPAPIEHVYMVSARPGSIRGWVVHKKQDDRIAVLSGVLQWAFWDGRPDSPTCGMLNVRVFSERNRVLFSTPVGVYHAVKNIGDTEALFVNMPTRPYEHDDPDKYRLPITNSIIPFDFGESD